MEKMGSILGILLVGMLSTAIKRTEAAVYVVGDAWGWQNPPNSTFYSSWASSHSFVIGDTLIFNFATGIHDVATVTEDAYNNCNTANPTNIVNNGPTNISLTTSGIHYYTCTFSGHCSRNQKLAVNVGGTNSTSPSPPGTSSGSPSPPPTLSNSSASTVASTAAFIFMSVAMVYMFM